MTFTPNLNGASPWWREAVFYQIYPLSFADSDGDGFGDLAGIISRLDYLSETLGVDALWLSPFYKSPMRDWGYDISGHTEVDPLFGSLETAELLIDEAHRRDMRVIVDFVMNHTSDEHPWFVESRSSGGNPKRDWYVWRDPKTDGTPPNNWVSVFSGPAWTLDEVTGQYYRHTYLAQQPDLNWRNPEVVEAMLDVARFWLDRGVDGFRVDAAHQMMKDPLERDNPPAPEGYVPPWKDMGEYDRLLHLYDLGHPDNHDAHRQFRKVIDEYPQEPLSVGEIHIFDLPEWASYYGESLDQLHMPFNFHLMASNWEANSLRTIIETVQLNIPDGAWTNWTLGNHDEKRLATRLGHEGARLAAMLLLTLRGAPFLYYGDELGMVDVNVPHSQGKDPWGENIEYLSRDGARSPMQWSAELNSGFTSGTPWLPLAPDSDTNNVESQTADPDSMLNLYRRLLSARRESEALKFGTYLTHSASTDKVLVYRRESNSDSATIALNMSDDPVEVSIDAGQVVISTLDAGRNDSVEKLPLRPWEGVLVSHRSEG